mmetsp:Transcript_29808/g.62243  ORF Transcript_29808/g.62243 Transcript_29808/m.62243 type:complete len:858 (-) Transcript_29808:905-3478(-)
MGCSTSHLVPRPHDGESSIDIFLYTGQKWSVIPRDVTHVRIDQSVKVIGAWAFGDCYQLREVEFCEGLVKIENHAFYDCKSLKLIKIPSTVKVIEKRAFCRCNQLEQAYLYEGLEQIEDEVFLDCMSLKCIRIPSTVKKISNGAFCSCSRLKEVELCEGLELVGSRAFWYNASLKYIEIPSTVKVISEAAFYYCERLKEMDLSEGVEEIEEDTFQYCKSLTSVMIPSTVKVISEGAFAYCVELESVQLREGLEKIGKNAFFDCRSLKYVEIPSTVKVIEKCSFRFCKQLEEIDLNTGLEEIGAEAFSYCISLKHVGNSSFVKVICQKSSNSTDHNQAEDAEHCEGSGQQIECKSFFPFYNCKSLNGAIVPSALKEIPSEAFKNCHQLVSAELWNGLKRIGESAFQDCHSLRNVAFPPRSQAPRCIVPSCHDLLALFGSQQMIFDALKNRFDGLPIHEVCYYQSRYSAQGTTQQLKASPLDMINTPENNQDCLGMTPLHILACSRKHSIEVYQFIIDKQPKSLIIEDKWGCPPILYAIWGNAPQEIMQVLIDSQKCSFPTHHMDWEKMIGTLCRSGTSLDIVKNLIEIQQTWFPDNIVDCEKVARELTIYSLVVCYTFRDHYLIWMQMVEMLSSSQTHTHLVQSLLVIHQRFFPDADEDTNTLRDYSPHYYRPDAIEKILCEEFAGPLSGWWKSQYNVSPNLETFRFLVKCRISERLDILRVRNWRKDIINMVKGIPSFGTSMRKPDFDVIHTKLVSYEQVKEAMALLELALWKSKLDQSKKTGNDAADMKVQCHVNCGADIIMPNVLSFLNDELDAAAAVNQYSESDLRSVDSSSRGEGRRRHRRRQRILDIDENLS